jgi:2,4-dienoyl-CoA reductase-like NADH-dependent reductase (Old Yellow Enzyme family)
MPQLFDPISFKNLTLKNRLMVSPMCQYSSKDGFASDWHLVHLGSRAVGGAALIMTEATAISPEGRISPDDLGIWKDDHLPMLKRIVEFVHAQDCKIGMQLAHAGRKGSTYSPFAGKGECEVSAAEGGWTTAAPSAVPFSAKYPMPVALDEAGIKKVKEDFKAAAIRANQAGFDVIEIHAAHGYLLSEFLSPLCNRRDDRYGGTLENRARLLMETISALQEVWPKEKPIFVRISATDWVDYGWSIDDSVILSKMMKDSGIDLVDCSSGGNTPDAKIPVGPLYQTPFAEKIKAQSNVPTGAVGIITEAHQANEIIESGKADLVIMAREFLRDPYFPLHAAKALGPETFKKVPYPKQYERAKR